MEKTYCVYKHTSPNGKVYIGVTCQRPTRRWNNGAGYANNNHFNSAIKKYGWQNFEHEVVAQGLSKEEASQTERELITLYQSNKPMYGYNHTSGGYDGYELNDDQIAALRERTQKQFSDESFKRKFNSLMRDPDRRRRVSDGLKKYYESPEAREKASTAQKRKFENPEYREKVKKLAQRRASDPKYREKLSRVLTEKRRNEEYRQSMTGANNPNAKRVLQYSLDGKLIKKYGSISDACREIGANHGNIISCIKGKTRTAYGYIWAYEGDSEKAVEKAEKIRTYVSPKAKPVIQCDLDGIEIMKFRSVTEACACIGASVGTVSMALRGVRKTAYGFIWKFA